MKLLEKIILVFIMTVLLGSCGGSSDPKESDFDDVPDENDGRGALLPDDETSLSTVLPVNTVRINELMANNTESILNPDNGNYEDWIEFYNPTDKAIDLTGHYLTDDPETELEKWIFPEGTTIQAGQYLLVWADGENTSAQSLHTNFKLSRKGETISLYDANNTLVDRLEFPSIPANISSGRNQDSASTVFYATATPGSINSSDTRVEKDRAEKADFSVPGGFYTEPQNVLILVNTPNTRLSVTTDGSEPQDSGEDVSSVTLSIDKTTVVRARSFSNSALPSKVTTNTYFINEETDLAVLSLTTAAHHLYDQDRGILVADADMFNHKDWERPVNFEYFDENKAAQLNQQVTLEMHGHISRTWPIKNLAIKAQGKFGKDDLDYAFFDRESKNPLRALIIRGTSVDQFKSYVRDPLIQSTIKNRMDLDYQDYRPVVLYINAEYQGIRYLRDRVNKDYLYSYHDIKDDDAVINVFSADADVKNIEQFQKINDFVETNNVQEPEVYENLAALVDLDSFVNFLIIQIYSGNFDSLGNNNKFWTNQAGTLPWRWFLFDLDLGFNECNVDMWGADYNSIEHVLAVREGITWPNPPETTLLLRKLVENDQFLAGFVQRLASHLNTSFSSERVIQLTNDFAARIETEMPRHQARWKDDYENKGSFFAGCWTEGLEQPVTTMAGWRSELDRIKDFANVRPAFVRAQIINEFGVNGRAKTSGWANLEVINAVPSAGSIKVSGVDLPASASVSGNWLKDLPITLTAQPAANKQFSHWQGLVNSDSKTIEIILTEDSSIEAVFE